MNIIRNMELRILRRRVYNLLLKDPQTFLGHADAAVREIGPGDKVNDHVADNYGILIEMPDGASIEAYLQTLWELLPKEYSEEDLRELLKNYLEPVKMIWNFPRPSWSENKELLRVRLLEQIYFTKNRHGVVARPWGDLYMAAALDYPQHIQWVVPSMLEDWQVSEDEVFDIGLVNLRKAFKNAQPKVVELDDGLPEVYLFSGDFDSYESSLPLVDEVIDNVPLKRSEQCVIIPERSTLAITRLSAQTMLIMSMMAKKYFNVSSHAVSPHVFVWRAGALRRLTIPSG